ncbi:hypothetical protein V8G54_010120 [Vigna mungo]|uniref:Uncharacterized protein n=1 Tax=Vigna mungo TaxID=3915 RepID=A0AAQ3NZG3_VIGMU
MQGAWDVAKDTTHKIKETLVEKDDDANDGVLNDDVAELKRKVGKSYAEKGHDGEWGSSSVDEQGIDPFGFHSYNVEELTSLAELHDEVNDMDRDRHLLFDSLSLETTLAMVVCVREVRFDILASHDG